MEHQQHLPECLQYCRLDAPANVFPSHDVTSVCKALQRIQSGTNSIEEKPKVSFKSSQQIKYVIEAMNASPIPFRNGQHNIALRVQSNLSM
jgi:hypothetical protein